MALEVTPAPLPRLMRFCLLTHPVLETTGRLCLAPQSWLLRRNPRGWRLQVPFLGGARMALLSAGNPRAPSFPALPVRTDTPRLSGSSATRPEAGRSRHGCALQRLQRCRLWPQPEACAPRSHRRSAYFFLHLCLGFLATCRGAGARRKTGPDRDGKLGGGDRRHLALS